MAEDLAMFANAARRALTPRANAASFSTASPQRRYRAASMNEDTLARLRRLLDNNISIERAWAELNEPRGLARPTIDAAEYLLKLNDPKRLQAWLAKHSAAERAAIRQHFEQRERRRMK
jgi:hypothetical protein